MPPKATIIGLINKKGRFESLVVFVKVNTNCMISPLKFEEQKLWLFLNICSLKVEEFWRPTTILFCLLFYTENISPKYSHRLIPSRCKSHRREYCLSKHFIYIYIYISIYTWGIEPLITCTNNWLLTEGINKSLQRKMVTSYNHQLNA